MENLSNLPNQIKPDLQNFSSAAKDVVAGAVNNIPGVSDAKDAFNNVKELGGKIAETADKLKNALKKPEIPKIPNLKTLRLRKPQKPKMKEIPVPQKFKKAADAKAALEAAKAAKEKAMAKIEEAKALKEKAMSKIEEAKSKLEAAKSMATDFKSKVDSISSNIPKF
jgi:hypothetical protein